MTEFHNIPPVFGKDARLLILGSFPSVKSREGRFFYHHPQNRFWPVLAAVLACPVPQTVAEKTDMLLTHGVSLWDVIASCDIVGSSDSSIKNAVPNDVGAILRPGEPVFCNGGTAYRLYRRYLEQSLGPAAVLPSTSPANAAWSLPRLTEAWRTALTPYL